jgi:hypothetical protein
LDYESYFIDRPHFIFTPFKKLAAWIVAFLTSRGKTAPLGLEIFAGSYLATDRLAARTPLRPAVVVKQEALARLRKTASRPTNPALSSR